MKADKRKKDQEMAARMKADKVKREVGRCPVCNQLIAISHLQNHLSFHK
jgi:uncharacterized protein with PIN domain